MRLALTVFGHTLTIDPRAELDHRVRPDQTLGFR